MNGSTNLKTFIDMDFNQLLINTAKSGAKLGTIEGAKMCNDCAFKAGTEPQNDSEFMEYLSGILMADNHLLCHVGDNTGKVCAGYKYFKQFFDNQQNKTQ